MKLYWFPFAPNPTKVRLYLAEKREGGADPVIEEVVVNLVQGEQNEPEHAARNPGRSLPVLELDDGTCLCESLVIMEYFEELHPEPVMIGASPLDRARVREVERIADVGVLMPTARFVHATRSPLGLPENPELGRTAREVLGRNLQRLETLLADGRPFVAGDAPSIADCTLAAAFHFARATEAPIALPDHLRRWDSAYRAHPAAQAVLIR